jgi:hypothetical protein
LTYAQNVVAAESFAPALNSADSQRARRPRERIVALECPLPLHRHADLLQEFLDFSCVRLIALERLMGMVLVAMAVQMFLTGLERFVRTLQTS